MVTDNTTLCGIKSASIDLEGDEDFLGFDCTICSSTDDLYVSQRDVNVSVSGKMVNVTVHSTGISSDILVALYREDKDNGVDVSNIFSRSVSVSPGSTVVNFNLSTLLPTDFVHVYIDTSNVVRSEIETNNYLFRAAAKPVKAYIDVAVSPKFSIVEDLILEYLASFVNGVDSVSEADIVILVGHPDFSDSEPFDFLSKLKSANGNVISKPYGGKVERGSFSNSYSGKPEVIAYGNNIEGTIAAVKRMINGRNIFLDAGSDTYVSYVDDFDTLGIGVFDLMHNSESDTYFLKNNGQFRSNVEKILYDNNFEVAVKPVVTKEGTSYGSNTTLRVKNVNSDFSQGYRDAVGVSSVPVVFSGGIFSNLFSWEENKA